MTLNGQMLESMGHGRGVNRRVRLDGGEGAEDEQD